MNEARNFTQNVDDVNSMADLCQDILITCVTIYLNNSINNLLHIHLLHLLKKIKAMIFLLLNWK